MTQRRSFRIGSLGRLYRDKDLGCRNVICLEMPTLGESTSAIRDTPAGRKRLAKQLRDAAKWAEK